jgi:hypothetical protein
VHHRRVRSHRLPGSGDLRQPQWRQTARTAYPDIGDEQLQYLADFATVEVGDIMLIPAYRDKFDVRIGVVAAPPTSRAPAFDGVHAYHYYYDITKGDWFENAHRVSVEWAARFATLSCLGRVWLKMFGRIVKGSDEVIAAAAERRLTVAS